MPVKESQFSRTQLWPKSNHNWMHPTALQGLSMYPQPFDVGALRVRDGFWEIFVNKAPSKANPLAWEWTYFNPFNPVHMYAANAFNRVGRGWSFGPAHGMHDEVRGLFQDVYGRNPTDMEKLDIEHDRGLWQDLNSRWKAINPVEPEPEPEPKPEPEPIDPVKPPSPPGNPPPVNPPPLPSPPSPLPSTLPPLSSLERRTQELLSLIPYRDMILPKFVIESLPRAVVELIKAKRNMEERIEQRIAQRVVEEIKKLK